MASAIHGTPTRQKAFDTCYCISSKPGLVTSSDGIVILDTLFTCNSEKIAGRLEKLGPDPMKVRCVVITHARGDNVGAAKLLQDLTHAGIVVGSADRDSIKKSVNGYPEGKPKRGITADDGQKIILGAISVTTMTTPGPTPGMLSMIFQVNDNGSP